ncbi:hypothetical protein WICPIJ_002829 [Wickerhamomyces pijperi]|uniref:Uncharacterized protein n=1 Tax=Wickerhamomyces pijperi TaxID=599730 RepID=A0A9P8TPG1_WICPI|nr:hypothetical protein WICPIJ_002829 [Wickerhamomyces pijperi]
MFHVRTCQVVPFGSPGRDTSHFLDLGQKPESVLNIDLTNSVHCFPFDQLIPFVTTLDSGSRTTHSLTDNRPVNGEVLDV